MAAGRDRIRTVHHGAMVHGGTHPKDGRGIAAGVGENTSRRMHARGSTTASRAAHVGSSAMHPATAGASTTSSTRTASVVARRGTRRRTARTTAAHVHDAEKKTTWKQYARSRKTTTSSRRRSSCSNHRSSSSNLSSSKPQQFRKQIGGRGRTSASHVGRESKIPTVRLLYVHTQNARPRSSTPRPAPPRTQWPGT